MTKVSSRAILTPADPWKILRLTEDALNGIRDDLIDNKDADDLVTATLIEQIAVDIRSALESEPVSSRLMPSPMTVEQIKAEFDTIHKLYSDDNLMWSDLEGLLYRLTEGVTDQSMPSPSKE